MNIKCEYKFITFHAQEEKIYTCKITEANITEKNQVIKRFKGVHKRESNYEDVEYVWFENTIVNYFPRGLYKHFRNLSHFEIFGCGINEISRKDLKGLDGLVRLHLKYCQLSSLPDDLFIEMPNLREVSFYSNRIEFASSKLLKPLITRENVEVDLRLNKNINARFVPGACISLNSLDELMKLIDEKCIDPVVAMKNQSINPEMDFNPKMKELWQTGRFSDLTITAGDKKFKVHKNILGMQSEVFAQIFEAKVEATEMKFPAFDSKAVEALLKFIYTSEVLDDDNLMLHFEIAEKFKIAAMKSSYEEIICDQLDDSNAFEVFLFAHRFKSQLLKKKAFDLIDIRFDEELPKQLMEDPEKMKRFLNLRSEIDNLLKN